VGAPARRPHAPLLQHSVGTPSRPQHALTAAAPAAAPAGVRVDADGAKLLNKLVGCLTKGGKRAKAHKIVVDAMTIINDKLARQRAAAAAAGQ
jgi:hypothetical protein